MAGPSFFGSKVDMENVTSRRAGKQRTTSSSRPQAEESQSTVIGTQNVAGEQQGHYHQPPFTPSGNRYEDSEEEQEDDEEGQDLTTPTPRPGVNRSSVNELRTPPPTEAKRRYTIEPNDVQQEEEWVQFILKDHSTDPPSETKISGIDNLKKSFNQRPEDWAYAMIKLSEIAKAAETQDNAISKEYTALRATNLKLQQQVAASDSALVETQTSLVKTQTAFRDLQASFGKQTEAVNHYKDGRNEYRAHTRTLKNTVEHLQAEINRLRSHSYDDTDPELQELRRFQANAPSFPQQWINQPHIRGSNQFTSHSFAAQMQPGSLMDMHRQAGHRTSEQKYPDVDKYYGDSERWKGWKMHL